ncbi:mannose-6-phosphate isomerase, class I [Corynebacterium sp. TAE3-ERU12]|uniref:mannose-6-phosphate isomerase, class I n=1 Tax=Corynebacterium sp. TAE3-ERU12 TaxID=2849491 RepID=UPI001C447544|nr:mannose-6-phosphate isomerase, class I [Corynebacterium sp. TAE3-ERU12]MBV7294812.1 mannose-6-phosphate isomerase, class I [Corynebacterium sp. TAE3-ERU12]
MERIEPAVQAYPWGSRTRIAELLGQPTPSPRPQAELWFGAHPSAPSTVGGRPFTEVLADDPAGQLGFEGELPFLLKVLAADAPLSLQAHPTLEQARAGYQAEDAAGVPLTAPQRNYRDPNHKPELLIALTQFDALAGFRPVEQTRELFAELAIPELDHYTVVLDDDEGLRCLFATWLTLPGRVLGELVETVRQRCAEYTGGGWIGEVAKTTAAIAKRYPGDSGVLAAMLLNRVSLQPGQAIFLAAGHLHAYLGGMGVEIMASSDNVLRGGLTSKHVDVVELLRVLTFSTVADPVIDPECEGQLCHYPTPVGEFEISSARVGQGHTVTASGPAMVLVTEGEARIGATQTSQGQAMWLPHGESAGVTALGSAQVFIATIPKGYSAA